MFVLVPEREFQACESKIPKFDREIAEIVKAPFETAEKKSFALQSALRQHQSVNSTVAPITSSTELYPPPTGPEITPIAEKTKKKTARKSRQVEPGEKSRLRPNPKQRAFGKRQIGTGKKVLW